MHSDCAIIQRYHTYCLCYSLHGLVFSGLFIIDEHHIPCSVIAPCGTFMTTFKVTPVKPGRFTLVVQFHSDQLADVTGDQDVTVADV